MERPAARMDHAMKREMRTEDDKRTMLALKRSSFQMQHRSMPAIWRYAPTLNPTPYKSAATFGLPFCRRTRPRLNWDPDAFGLGLWNGIAREKNGIAEYRVSARSEALPMLEINHGMVQI
jgi:hypothetical protein